MKYNGYRLLELRELQLLQLDVMKEIHEVCVKNGINYYIIGGTLLGAIRHKGFIPWDDDIDIAMMREDFDKFKNIYSHNFNDTKYFLQHYDSDIDFQPAMMRLCVKNTILDVPSQYHLRNCKNTYIDIFPLDNVPDSDEKMAQHAKCLNRIDTLIKLKLFHVFPSNTRSQVLLKKSIALLLKVVPLQFLQRRRVSVMTKYINVDTKRVASTCSQYGYIKQVMDKDIYGDPTLYQFEDVKFYGPEKYDAYLTHLFGRNYMQIPPLNKRVKPHDNYIKI